LSQREAADRALEAALEEKGARDPRDFYRQRLRELRDANSEAYDSAVEYFQDRLIPSIASGEAEPLDAWTEYGRTLAELSAPGRTVSIDQSGRSAPYALDRPPETLVLHLPDAANRRAMVVALPPKLSSAQRATYDWLVQGARS
jgi:hypothetical protein